jgi:hypothetical protein
VISLKEDGGHRVATRLAIFNLHEQQTVGWRIAVDEKLRGIGTIAEGVDVAGRLVQKAVDDARADQIDRRVPDWAMASATATVRLKKRVHAFVPQSILLRSIFQPRAQRTAAQQKREGKQKRETRRANEAGGAG